MTAEGPKPMTIRTIYGTIHIHTGEWDENHNRKAAHKHHPDGGKPYRRAGVGLGGGQRGGNLRAPRLD